MYYVHLGDLIANKPYTQIGSSMIKPTTRDDILSVIL